MSINKLNKRVEVWANVPIENELGEDDYDHEPKKLKTIWCGFTPQTATMRKSQAGNILSEVDTKITTRYNAGKDIEEDMWFVYKGKRYDIKYILNPYMKNEELEFFTQLVIE